MKYVVVYTTWLCCQTEFKLLLLSCKPVLCHCFGGYSTTPTTMTTTTTTTVSQCVYVPMCTASSLVPTPIFHYTHTTRRMDGVECHSDQVNVMSTAHDDMYISCLQQHTWFQNTVHVSIWYTHYTCCDDSNGAGDDTTQHHKVSSYVSCTCTHHMLPTSMHS